ncbi:MAG: TrbI/VirB10 family protein [Cyanobacteria bacterium J06639_14]
MSTPDNFWDEQEMADLVGLQLPDKEAAAPETESASPATNNGHVPDSGPLLDPEDLDESAAVGTDQKTGRSIAANPFTKLGVVAAGTGLVIGVLAVFTSGIMNRENSPPAQEAQADFAEPMVAADESAAADDRGQLLTDLAMGQQQAELEALTQEESTPRPEPEPAATQEAPQFSSPPRPAPRSPQPVVQRSAPTSRPTLAPRVSAAQPSSAVTAPEPEGDPMEQWMALSQIGSYRRGTSASDVDESPLLQQTDQLSFPDSAVLARNTTTSTWPAINHAEEAAILQERPLPTSSAALVTGTQAAAVLETPLIWAAATETETPQFVVKLTEPLLTPEEAIGLPVETALVVQVDSVDESGLAQLAVVSLIRDGHEVALPIGAIQLRGLEGTPLIAQKYGDSGSDIARMDLNMAAMSGVSRVAELINRPQSSSVISNAGGSTVTQETGDPNILAGLLEGAFGQLSEQMAERNQAALEEILNRPTIWYLPPGTEVEVYINQTVTL